MSESVADDLTIPSPDEGAAAPEVPATDWQAKATEFQNRFAGSQRSLTTALQERDALKAEAEALRQFKANAERANMTELEAAKADAEAARAEAAAARSQVARLEQARKFPNTFAALGDKMPSDEEALAILEQRLVAQPEVVPEPEPTIDPNNPRKQTPTGGSDPALENAAFLEALFPHG